MNKVDEKFFEAIFSGNPEAVEEALIDGANPFERIEGVSPLALASNQGKLEVFKYLLEVTKGGQSLNKDEDLGNDTLLTRLLRDPFMVTDFPLALIEAGADVNIRNKRGEDPLSIAVNFDKVNEVKALIEAGADIDYIEPNLKTTPFLTAARRANKDVLEAMIKKNVDVNKVNTNGLNALNLVTLAYSPKMTKEEKKVFFETFKLLVDSGVNVNNVAKSGLTPLWSAAFLNKEMDNLVENGADVFAEHERGMSKRESFAHFALSNLPETSVRKEKKNGKIVEIVSDFAVQVRNKIFENFKYGYKNTYGNTLEGLLALNMFKKPENLIAAFQIYLNSDLSQLVYPQGNESKTKKSNSQILPMTYGIIYQLPEDSLIALMKMKQERGEKIDWLFLNNKEVLPQAQPINAFIKTNKLEALRFAASLTNNDPTTWEVTNKIGHKLNAQNLLSKILFLPNRENLEVEFKKYTQIAEAIETNKKNGVESELLTPEAVKEVEVRIKQLTKQMDVVQKYQEEVANNLKHVGFKFEGKNKDGIPYIFDAEYLQTIELYEKFGADITSVDSKGNNIIVNAIMNIYPVETVAKLGLFLNLKGHNDLWSGVWNQLAYHNIGESLIQRSVEGLFNNINYIFGQNLPEGEKVVVPGVNEKDEDGNTPLMTALANGYPYYASAMIKFGVDVNEANNEGETPLMYAVSLENEAIFRKLLEAGADINKKTLEGLSVKDLLEDIEDSDFVEIVESALNEKIVDKKKFIFKK